MKPIETWRHSTIYQWWTGPSETPIEVSDDRNQIVTSALIAVLIILSIV